MALQLAPPEQIQIKAAGPPTLAALAAEQVLEPLQTLQQLLSPG